MHKYLHTPQTAPHRKWHGLHGQPIDAYFTVSTENLVCDRLMFKYCLIVTQHWVLDSICFSHFAVALAWASLFLTHVSKPLPPFHSNLVTCNIRLCKDYSKDVSLLCILHYFSYTGGKGLAMAVLESQPITFFHTGIWWLMTLMINDFSSQFFT